MKINLGCGDDVRIGYLNVDLLPKGEHVTRGDWKNLDPLGVQNDSVEEILAIDVLQYIAYGDLGKVIQHWIDKLKSGGSLYLETFDYNYLGTLLQYEQVNIQQVNEILFSTPPLRGLYNLPGIEIFCKQNGMETEQKGFKDIKFYLKMVKS